MTAQLDKDAKYWADQETNLSNGNAAVPFKINQLLEEFKKSFVQVMFNGLELKQAPVFDISKFPLKDLERFGD